MSPKWNDMTVVQRIATVISYICCAAFIAELVLDFTNVWNDQYFLSFIIVSIIGVCEAVIMWKAKRSLSYFWIAVAVISAGCFCLSLFL